MEVKAEQLGEQVLKLCRELFEVYDIILDSRKYAKMPDRFFYMTFKKIMVVLDAAHIQIYNLDNKPHYAIATGLLLRTCLLDVINLYYVLDALNNEDEVIERINAVMADHLKYEYKKLPVEQQAKIRLDWPELFDTDKNLKKYDWPNSRSMVDKIVNFPHIKPEAKTAQKLYSIFSKYEHNGAFTFDLLHNPYSADGNGIVKSAVKDAVGCCAIALKVLSSHWISEEHEVSRKLHVILADILRKGG